jgi:hypothetical protein
MRRIEVRHSCSKSLKVLLVLAVVLLAGTASAMVREVSFPELTRLSETTMEVVVVNSYAEWNAEHTAIFTHYVVEPIRRVGGSDGAACPLQGTVAGLRGGSTLAVRAGPGTGFARVDRLANGSRVYLCDRSGDAGWVGIVYGAADCGLAAPITPPRAYAGTCQSGWVRSNYLR